MERILAEKHFRKWFRQAKSHKKKGGYLVDVTTIEISELEIIIKKALGELETKNGKTKQEN